MALTINLKNIIHSNSFCFAASIIIGYLTWSILAQSNIINKKITVPIVFYNHQNLNIQTSGQITLEITGQRGIINNIDNKDVAVHIDAQELKLGDNLYIITKENLFLAPDVILSNYNPHMLKINVQKIIQEITNG